MDFSALRRPHATGRCSAQQMVWRYKIQSADGNVASVNRDRSQRCTRTSRGHSQTSRSIWLPVYPTVAINFSNASSMCPPSLHQQRVRTCMLNSTIKRVQSKVRKLRTVPAWLGSWQYAVHFFATMGSKIITAKKSISVITGRPSISVT